MRKMISGVPTILFYNHENETLYPDDSVSGTDTSQITSFFVKI